MLSEVEGYKWLIYIHASTPLSMKIFSSRVFRQSRYANKKKLGLNFPLFVLKLFHQHFKLEEKVNNRISIDPNICHGQACIKGTRIPVHQIVHMLANGDTIEDLLQSYPTIEREDILACLDYAAELAEELVTPI